MRACCRMLSIALILKSLSEITIFDGSYPTVDPDLRPVCGVLLICCHSLAGGYVCPGDCLSAADIREKFPGFSVTGS